MKKKLLSGIRAVLFTIIVPTASEGYLAAHCKSPRATASAIVSAFASKIKDKTVYIKKVYYYRQRRVSSRIERYIHDIRRYNDQFNLIKKYENKSFY